MKTAYFVFTATLTLGSFANAQENNRLDLRPYENKALSVDSLVKKWGVSVDSLSKRETLRNWKFDLESGTMSGTLPIEDGMLRGTTLDNQPSTSGYIQDGKKYYIRNFTPNVESKPVREGSHFYLAK